MLAVRRKENRPLARLVGNFLQDGVIDPLTENQDGKRCRLRGGDNEAFPLVLRAIGNRQFEHDSTNDRMSHQILFDDTLQWDGNFDRREFGGRENNRYRRLSYFAHDGRNGGRQWAVLPGG